MYPALAPIAKDAIRQPSTRRCGSCRMISRSLQVPGSDSSALTTRSCDRPHYLVGIDHEIVRPVADLLAHEGPFQPGRKAGAAAPALARGLHLVDDRVAAPFQDRLGAVRSEEHT